MPQIAGKWRTVPVQVGNWLPPEPYEIPVKMHEYIANMKARLDNAETLDLQIEALAYAEGEFLLRFKKYQNALAEYDNGRIANLVEFWQERLG